MGVKASPLEWSKASESKVSAEGGAAAVCRLEGCVLSGIPSLDACRAGSSWSQVCGIEMKERAVLPWGCKGQGPASHPRLWSVLEEGAAVRAEPGTYHNQSWLQGALGYL